MSFDGNSPELDGSNLMGRTFCHQGLDAEEARSLS